MDILYWVSVFISFASGSLFGIMVIGLCKTGARCDLESKVYELRSKLEVERYRNRQYPLKDAD